MDENKLIKYDDKQLQKVGNAIAVTSKILALVEPQLIPYRKGDKWGYCTADKRIVIDCIYDSAEPFDGAVATVGLFKEGYGCINKKGEIIIPCIYRHRLIFKEDLAIIQIPDTGDSSWVDSHPKGFINKQGVIIVPMQYDYVRPFSEGFAVVSKNTDWGGIDKSGEEVISLKYERMHSFFEGLGAFKMHGKWGFMDKTGKEVISNIYEECRDFSGGTVAVLFRNSDYESRWGLIDKMGKTVTPFRINYYPDKFFEGLAALYIDGQNSVFVSRNLTLAFPFYYNDCKNFSEGLAAVCIHKKWGFIDKAGQIVIPCFYDDCSGFSDNTATVLKDGLWGCIDKTGKLILAHKYTKSFSFKNGYASIYNEKKRGLLGFLNKDGEEFWED